MFGLFKATLPISEEKRLWADKSFVHLASLLGWHRMLDARVMLPVAEDFPDPYNRSEQSVSALFERVARQMDVNPQSIHLQIFDDTDDATRSLVPFWSGRSEGAGGLYREVPDALTEISINASKLSDPMALVATLAHELSHVILLGRDLVDRDADDMEPMTDLLTVFLGFGVFNANAAFQFKQYTNNDTQGWSVQRAGYLSEELFAYALARFAFERGETNPPWAKYLSTNLSSYFRRSSSWLKAHGDQLSPTSPGATG